MMFTRNQFDHYLSYGATDQSTVTALAQYFDGLVVPGTVAAFQREGTGGFVLSLSASRQMPYVIDSRFPLFQQALPQAKKSHEALAALVGEPSLVQSTVPLNPTSYTSQMIDRIASEWVGFCTGYSEVASAKFAKYAKRLGEEITPQAASGPEFVLPPYFIAADTSDPWWTLSCDFFDAARARHQDCLRVVATENPSYLSGLLSSINDERAIVWVSALDELEASAPMLAAYGTAIRAASENGKQTFALYGGFFSVLLASVGLGGSSHGIGFGEKRNWVELPQSGPPPARYYLPQVHCYVSQELAYQLWLRDRTLAECGCNECQQTPPIALEYHALMKHSVLSRAAEVQSWSGMSLANMIDRLERETADWLRHLDSAQLPLVMQTNAERASDHLHRWTTALRLIDQTR